MRWKRIVAIGVLAIAILIAALYVYLNTYDYNKLKPLIARMVEDATGRRLNLGGEIKLAIGLSPSLVVTDVTFANAAWGSQPQMIEIEKLEASIRLLPLLFKDVELKHIGLAGVDVWLETDSNGQGNWDFAGVDRSGKSFGAFEPANLDIDSIRVENLNLAFRGDKSKSAKRFSLARLDMARQATGAAQAFDLKTEYNGQPVVLTGTTGPIRNWFAHRRFPLQLSGKFSNAAVTIDGAIEDVLNLHGIDLRTRASGTNLEELRLDLGMKLPKTNAFEITGRLMGSGESLAFKDISGNFSTTDVDIVISGVIGDLVSISGVDLKLGASGKDLAKMGPIIGEKLPVTDEFAVEGLLTGSAKTLSLKKAQGRAKRDSLNVVLSGEVKNLIAFSGVDLKVNGGGKNLAEIGKIIDVDLPPTDQFEIQGRLFGSTEALALQEAEGSFRRGSMSLAVSGGITQLLTLEGINIKLKASGKELADIGPLVAAELPELGPFDASGRLLGSAKAISLNEFSAVVDQSDFNGRAKLEFLKRPKITVRLESSVIDFTALMKSLEKDEQKADHQAEQKDRLFSDDPLPFDVLNKVDADVLLKARNIRAKEARLEFGHLTLKLEDGDFSTDKLEATYKKTKISGNLHIHPGPPTRVASHFLVQNFDLGGFLKETGKSDRVRAVVDIAAHGKSSGDSVHSLMAALDGSIGAVMGKGYLSRYLDLISINLSQKVRKFWRRQKKGHQIKCAVVQFDIKKGIAESQAFVFDTQAGILSGEGEINLDTEQINFLLVPKPKSLSLSFSTKLRVKGTIMDPRVRPDNLALLTKGAGLLSSLVVGPLGLLSPFVSLGAHKKHPCDIQSIGQLGLNIPGKKK
jgi:uncharacterized protein involved in outer membrane biogenesis